MRFRNSWARDGKVNSILCSIFINLSSDYEIRPYQESDSDQSVELLTVLFDGWPKYDIKSTSLEHFHWKYNENPVEMSTGIIALDNKKVIASTHTFMYQIKIWDNYLLGGMGADAGVHPDYRRRGIYNTIGKYKFNYEKEKGLGFRLHMSGNPILVERSKRRARSGTGERVIFPFPLSRLVKIFDTGYHVDKTPGKKKGVKKN